MQEDTNLNSKPENNINPEISVREHFSADNGSKNNNKRAGAQKYFSAFWEFLKIVIIAALIVLPIRYFVFQPFIVKGESMVPNLQSGDYLIVDEISYKFSDPQRGDIIVLKYPLDASQRFIKRIIGLPGETVEIKNGKITISKGAKSFVLNEKKYLPNLSGTSGDLKVSLTGNQYFVLGDNRQFSYDSRMWGILPKNDIIGRAAFRVFPVSNMSYISDPGYQL